MPEVETDERRLVDFLVESFSDGEFRDAIAWLPDGDSLVPQLLPPSRPVIEVVRDAVGLLRRHGYIDASFFDVLEKLRPRLSDKVREISRSWTWSTDAKPKMNCRRFLIKLDLEFDSLVEAHDVQTKLLALVREHGGDSSLRIESVSRGSTWITVVGPDAALERLALHIQASKSLGNFRVEDSRFRNSRPEVIRPSTSWWILNAPDIERHARYVAGEKVAGGGVVEGPRDLVARSYVLELGRRLRKLREERKMTQFSLAKRSHVSVDMISHLESGHYQSASLRTLLRVADGLGVRVAELLPEVDSPPVVADPAALRRRVMNMARQASLEELEMLLKLADLVLRRRASIQRRASIEELEMLLNFADVILQPRSR